MDYFEKMALDEFKEHFGNEKGIVTLSMWNCDCSGHPYRPYGIVSYMVENGILGNEIDTPTSVMYDDITMVEYNGETLPHVVIFQEIY